MSIMIALDDLNSRISKDLPNSESRNNNFNLLRLILAAMVILAHSAELIDGNRNREPLTSLFHTLTLGEVAVDGFFLLSGYLILQSWILDPNAIRYLKKRVLRIYPGFIVATLVCTFIVGPLGAHAQAYFNQLSLLKMIKYMLMLMPTPTPPVFQGQPYPLVCSAMWTIAYEFRCYLLVVILGRCGVLNKRASWLWLAAGLLLLSLFQDPLNHVQVLRLNILIGNAFQSARLTSLFLVGGCFYLYRERISYSQKGVMVAGTVLIASLFWVSTSKIGIATAGAYLLLTIAFSRAPWFDRLKSRTDISYGLYLYGWPVQKLLYWYIPTITPWVLFPFSLVIAALCGWISWKLVEQPFLRLKPQKLRLQNPIIDHTS